MSSPEVSVIIVNWNGLEDTTECLESLKKSHYADYEVVVVDNCSAGADAAILKQTFGDYIHVIRNDRNLGCAEGFNTGIRYVMEHSGPRYILIMNNDVVVAPDCLGELLKAAGSDDRIAIVGPKIYHYDYKGRQDVIWAAGGRVRWWALKVHHSIGGNDDDLPKYQTQTETDWITGCVMMVRSTLTEEMGLLNPWYFIGYEDVEYCLKARKLGYKIVYVPTARVWHKVGSSTKRANIRFADPVAYYYLIRHAFPWTVLVYQLLLMPAVLCRWAFLYLVRCRDVATLRTFISGLARIVTRRGKRDV